MVFGKMKIKLIHHFSLNDYNKYSIGIEEVDVVINESENKKMTVRQLVEHIALSNYIDALSSKLKIIQKIVYNKIMNKNNYHLRILTCLIINPKLIANIYNSAIDTNKFSDNMSCTEMSEASKSYEVNDSQNIIRSNNKYVSIEYIYKNSINLIKKIQS